MMSDRRQICYYRKYHYICDRISEFSDFGLGCPRLGKGYLVRITLFFVQGIIFTPSNFPFSSYMLGHITSYGKLTASGSNIWRVIGYAIRSAIWSPVISAFLGFSSMKQQQSRMKLASQYASLTFIRDCCCHTLEKSFLAATDRLSKRAKGV